MKSLHYIILIFISFGIVFVGNGQILSEKKDTLYLDLYEGVMSYQYKLVEDKKIPHGTISFESELFRESVEREIKQIIFQGNYLQGLKDKTWTFNETTYTIELQNINERRGLYSIDYNLSGKEKQLILNFSSGVPDGNWLFKRSSIENGRKRPQTNTGELNFNQGLGIGKVSYINQDQNTNILFTLNDDSFIDGKMELSYPDSSSNKVIEETRFYENGFLLRIEKVYEKMRSPFEIIIYEDITNKLDSLSQYPDEVNYKISEGEGFGLLFDNGYVSEEEKKEKIHSQEQGNVIIENFLTYFQSFIDSEQETFQSPRFNFTKRIKYAYPEEETEMLKKLKKDLQELCVTYNDFVNEPRNKLYKTKSKGLSEAMAYIQHANKKCSIIDNQIDRFLSGEFDFKYRPNFFISGIDGLNKIDTLKYRFKSDTATVVFDVGILVKKHENIVQDMSDYFYKMKAKTADYKLVAKDKIQLFREQDDIDSLDVKIVSTQDINDSLYGKIDDLRSANFDDLDFHQKIYVAFLNELLLEVKDNYLEVHSYEEKKELGEKLSCFYSKFYNEHTRLVKVGEQRASLDSLFTVFEDHPFDNRKFESRILGNVREKGGETLFRYYIEDLLKTAECDKISTKIDRLEKLFKKLEKLAASHNDEETIRINRLVRRESVPNRIERVLGLSDDN